jgi:hypothetical protein
VFRGGRRREFSETRFVITSAYTGGSDVTWWSAARAAKFSATACCNWIYKRSDIVLQLGQMEFARIPAICRAGSLDLRCLACCWPGIYVALP